MRNRILTCDNCGGEFVRKGFRVKEAQKRGYVRKFCSRKCAQEASHEVLLLNALKGGHKTVTVWIIRDAAKQGLLQERWLTRPCVKCGGDLYQDKYGEVVCLNCGKRQYSMMEFGEMSQEVARRTGSKKYRGTGRHILKGGK